MSADRISEGDTPVARLVCLLALANAPAIALVAFLVVEPNPPARALAAAALAAGLLGCALSVAHLARSGRRLREVVAVRSEQAERLRCVVEAAAHPILTIDDGGHILSANGAAARAFAYPPGDLTGLPLEALLGGEADRVADAKTDEQRVLGVGRPVEAVRKDGSRFPASIDVTRARPSPSAPPLSVVLVHDQTELVQIRRAAEVVSRSKDSLLGRVNHELRTPLAGILGTVDLLRDGAGSHLHRHLDVIQELGESLLRGFEQLVEYARLEAGQVEVRRQPFSLRQAVERALAPLLPLARAKGLRIDVQFAADLHDHFDGDAGRIAQVLMSLVGNAVKFTPSGSVNVRVGMVSDQSSVSSDQLSVSSDQSAVNGDQSQRASSLITDHCSLITLHFEVSDTGVGIPADRLRAIFEPFEQADGSSTRHYGGMGMGLSVASRLASLMGGRIDARSEPGKGSRFRFDVPLEKVRVPASPLGSVLVVLSHDQARRDLERHLGEHDLRAAGARTGRQALTELLRAVVEGSPYSLLLIEEHLPDLSAREVLHRLRDRSDVAPPAVLLGRSETDLPLPEGVKGVLPRGASPAQTYQAILRTFACHER